MSELPWEYEFAKVTINVAYKGSNYFARIGHVDKVWLGNDDHGSHTGWVDLKLGWGNQGAGGFSFGSDEDPPNIRLCMWFWMLGELFGTWDFNYMKGKYVLALYEDDKPNSFIKGLAHPTDSKKVFIFEEVFK